MKTVLTLTRVYYKEVKIELDNSLLKGLSNEEIAEYLIGDYPYDEEESLFSQAELQDGEPDDEDRYDIYDDMGNQVYGGHL